MTDLEMALGARVRRLERIVGVMYPRGEGSVTMNSEDGDVLVRFPEGR